MMDPSTTKGLIMKLDLADLAYLSRVYDAVKSDNPPQMPTVCPECDETVEPGDGEHITLTTYIPTYWAERGDWPEPNVFGMSANESPFVLIGCEGYHTLPKLSETK